MDKVIIKIGYEDYVTDLTEETFGIIKALKGMIPVKNDYVNNEKLYYPKEDEKGLRVEVEFIDERQFREPTNAERENEQIKNLKNSLKWKEDELKKEKEAKKAVECELELLKKQEKQEF